MKKIKYFFFLLIPVLLSSCMGINTTPYVNNPVSTSVELSGNNFRIVKMVTGEVAAKYVFGFGGGSQKVLRSNAIAEMYKNADLHGRQAIVNISVALSTKSVLGALVMVRTATAYGYVIEYGSASDAMVVEIKEEVKPVEKVFENASMTDAEQNAILKIWATTEKQKRDKQLSFKAYKTCDLTICFLPKTLKRKKADFVPDMKACTNAFYEKFNNCMGDKGINFKLKNGDSDLTATYYVCDLDHDGEIYGYIEFKDKAGKVILRQYINADGGKGIKLEKSISGSMENSAEELAKALKVYFKK